MQWKPDEVFNITGDELMVLSNYIFGMVMHHTNQTPQDPFSQMVNLNNAQKVLIAILNKGKEEGKVTEDKD